MITVVSCDPVASVDSLSDDVDHVYVTWRAFNWIFSTLSKSRDIKSVNCALIRWLILCVFVIAGAWSGFLEPRR